MNTFASSSVRALALVFTFAVVAASAAGAAETTMAIGTHGMTATLIAPDDGGPHPGVIVLHPSGGLEDADLDVARKLANEGYVSLVPAFMAAYGITAATCADAFTRDGVDVDLAAGVAALQRDPRVAGSPVGAIGFSNGGYFAAWLALTGKVAAGVGYYGAYSGAGGRHLRGGGGAASEPAGDAVASADAWARTLAFLGARLHGR